MKYICPFCYKTMPEGYEPSGWRCCGEVGHAMILPECPKCGAEQLSLPLSACEVCGWKLRIDDEELSLLDIQNGHGTGPYVSAKIARQLEQGLNAALIAAGVASMERGEWAAERIEHVKVIAQLRALEQWVRDLSEQSDENALDMLHRLRREHCKPYVDTVALLREIDHG